MIKTKTFEIPLREGGFLRGFATNYDFSEIEDFINQIGEQNVLSITSCMRHLSDEAIYTVFYDDGK